MEEAVFLCISKKQFYQEDCCQTVIELCQKCKPLLPPTVRLLLNFYKYELKEEVIIQLMQVLLANAGSAEIAWTQPSTQAGKAAHIIKAVNGFESFEQDLDYLRAVL